MTCIKPTLDSTGETLVVFLLSFSIPWLRMGLQPPFTLIFPLRAQTSGNGISQPKRDEVRTASLLPVWKKVLGKPNLLVRIKEPQCVHCEAQGVTASQPSQLARRLGSRRSLKDLPHVFYGRAAVRDYLIVVFFEIELVAEFFLFGSAQIEMLRGADEVGGELNGSKPGAFPFGHRFALLLVTFFGHQIHRFLLTHVSGVDALIENGVTNRAQPHLQLLHLHLGAAVSLFRHHLFAINRPALNEGSALENCANQRRRAEFIRARELQEMPRHRLMHGQIANHIVVVFAEERFLSLF